MQLLIIGLEEIAPPIVNAINTYLPDFYRGFDVHPSNVIEIEDLFEYCLLKSLSGIIGINLTHDYLLTELYDMFYSAFMEGICLTLAMKFVKSHNLMLLSNSSRVKVLVTFSEIIFSIR